MTHAGEGQIDATIKLQPEGNGGPFEIAVVGAELATTALVLVHGFGVKRDSRGLFTELSEATRDTALVVSGDFSDTKGKLTHAVPLTHQAARLRTIIDFIGVETQSERLVLVGHSQGSLTVALADPEYAEIALLAPPLGTAYENFIKTPGWTKRGSKLDIAGESRLVRKDGSVIEVDCEFWNDFRALHDVDPLVQQLATENGVKIYFAGADSILGEQLAPNGIENETIPDADHDFAHPARTRLIEKILADLEL